MPRLSDNELSYLSIDKNPERSIGGLRTIRPLPAIDKWVHFVHPGDAKEWLVKPSGTGEKFTKVNLFLKNTDPCEFSTLFQ